MMIFTLLQKQAFNPTLKFITIRFEDSFHVNGSQHKKAINKGISQKSRLILLKLFKTSLSHEIKNKYLYNWNI